MHDTIPVIRIERVPQARIPLIAMTACSMTGDREIFLQAGMNGYLAKPVRKEDLAKAIERVMTGQ